jgi:hypothetical protein
LKAYRAASKAQRAVVAIILVSARASIFAVELDISFLLTADVGGELAGCTVA